MRLETIDRGIALTKKDQAHVSRALQTALDQYMETISLVRVRLLRAGTDVRCKMRAWCGAGPTIVATSVRPTTGDAVDATADTLQRAIRRRTGRMATARRKGVKHGKLVGRKGT
jgi:hypothetical protein